jgi:Ca2+-binding EF-hand superfamily protein
MQALSFKAKTGKKALRKLFNGLDIDNSSELDMAEFKSLCERFLGRNIDPKVVRGLFMEFDTDKSGTVDWDEFLAYSTKITEEGKVNKHYSTRKWKNADAKSLPRLHRPTKTGAMRSEQAQDYHSKQHRRFSMLGGSQAMAVTNPGGANPDQALVDPHSLDAVCRLRAFGHQVSVTAAAQTFRAKLNLHTKTNKAKLRKIFDQADANGNGVLEVEELRTILQRFVGTDLNAALFAQLRQEMDVNDNGCIEFEELVEYAMGCSDPDARPAHYSERIRTFNGDLASGSEGLTSGDDSLALSPGPAAPSDSLSPSPKGKGKGSRGSPSPSPKSKSQSTKSTLLPSLDETGTTSPKHARQQRTDL